MIVKEIESTVSEKRRRQLLMDLTGLDFGAKNAKKPVRREREKKKKNDILWRRDFHSLEMGLLLVTKYLE